MNTITRASHIEAVIKVAERCNINCSYCYVFNKGNETYKGKPAKISRETMLNTIKYLVKGVEDLSAKQLSIIFHGGEPLMLGKREFNYFLSEIKPVFENRVKLRIGVQSNGMLIDEEWINLFTKYEVGVGISLDGPRDVHDKERRDHKDKGTYDRTINGLKRLQRAAREGRITYPGVICVIDPSADGRATYRHFVDNLDIRGMTFHLPMDTYESFGNKDPMPYAKFLCDVFDEWAKDNNPNIYVRMFEQFLRFLHGRWLSDTYNLGHTDLQHITVESDGAIGIDELKPTLQDDSGYNVAASSLAQFVNSDMSYFMRELNHSLPTECMPCIWKRYCRGGLQHGVQVNRWSSNFGFNNKSVLCEALKKIYAHITYHAISAGLEEDKLCRSLEQGDEALPQT